MVLAATLGLLAVLQQAPGPDTTRTLTFEEFYGRVARFHPVARQAQLVRDQAGEGVRIAQADILDPTLEVSWDQKNFGSTGRYYNYVFGGLKIPTPFGLEFKLGYEESTGPLINPEFTPGGVVTAGVVVPLGQGLLTDARRNAVAQARAARDAAEGDRRGLLNKLLFAAAKDYSLWYETWRRRQLTQEAVELARFRYDVVRQRYRQGDAAAIDTVEALLEINRRLGPQLEADVAYRNFTIVVEGYLWSPAGDPLALAPGAVPSLRGLELAGRDTLALDGWLAQALRQHPDLVKALARVRAAEAQRRFTGQELLPDASLGLSALLDSDRFTGGNFLADRDRSNKVSVAAKSALLLMKERGRFNLAGDRLEFQRLDAELVRRGIRIDVETAANALLNLGEQIDVQRQTVEQSRIRRDGEQARFLAGESTLFLVNLWERALVDEQVKLAALEAKYAAARAELAVALGEPARLPGTR